MLGKATAEQGYDLCSRDLQWKGMAPTSLEEQRKRSAVKNKAAEMTGYVQDWHRKSLDKKGRLRQEKSSA